MEKTVKEAINNNIKSKLFGLLRERERGREWEAFLDSIQIELMGIPEDQRSINYYHLSWKVNSLRYLNYKFFRSTIFDFMSILGKMSDE